MGNVVNGALNTVGLGKTKAPQAPDYTAAAQQQGQQNTYAAITNALLNRVNQTGPFGSQTFSQSGTQNIGGVDVPTYTASTTYDPSLQSTITNLEGQANTANATPLDFSSLPGAYNQDAADAAYSEAARYLDPQWNQAYNTETTRLANAGFSVDSDPNSGYNKAIQNFNLSKDAAYGDARDRAVATGNQVGIAQRQQAISEMLAQRQFPLQQLSAMPGQNFAPIYQGAQTSAAPVFQAADAQYGASADAANLQAAQRDAALQAIASMTGSALSGGAKK